MNKQLRWLAFVLYIVGVIVVVDWFVFWELHYANDFNQLHKEYIEHFPDFLQPFFNSRFATILFVFSFMVAGLIFVRQKFTWYHIIGITSFLFASWNLFTLM